MVKLRSGTFGSLIIFITVQHLLLILNIFALVLGALATQSCQDISWWVPHAETDAEVSGNYPRDGTTPSNFP